MGAGRLLVADLDGTLLGDDAALGRFGEWLAPRRHRYRLVYASGRRLAAVHEAMAEAPLPAPDAVISSVGTEVHDERDRPWPAWRARFAGWHADRVRAALQGLPRLALQAPEHQSDLKASYDVVDLTPAERAVIRRALAAAAMPAVLVYSGGRHLDVLPLSAGKGRAARFLANAWAIGSTDVLAFGDSGNDAELLAAGFRGTLVANALPEIRAAAGPDVYRSPLPFADGVLDGIRHWSAVARPSAGGPSAGRSSAI